MMEYFTVDQLASEEVPPEFVNAVEDSFTTFSYARQLKDEGWRLLGYFPVYFPEELARSLGFHTVRLLGASGRVALDIATAHTQSFVCSISRSVFQLLKQGNLGVFDALIFSNICDVARNLSGIVKRNIKNGMHVDYIHYPINNTFSAAVDYLVDELKRVAEGLEHVSGRKISSDTLAANLKLFNEKRRLQRELLRLKMEKPWAASYVDVYVALRAGGIMEPTRYNEMLRAYLERLKASEGKRYEKVRVMVFGDFCEQPPLPLFRVIEDAGCYIVNDESNIGSYWIGEVNNDGGDPLHALAKAYVQDPDPLTVRFHPGIDKKSYIIDAVKRVGAEAVIFCTPKFCEPALYDYVVYKTALHKAGIPTLHIEYEESSSSFEQARLQAESFVESIIFD